ncbi:SGNH/GDSL hydrolase family protein [Salinarimonas sp. NSM]|uniref:SGNH/GDSL hydrolase family protein n=1 Tax=Salinarimonas sp. NSM TaxID=3458003 RepID=UPI0040374FA5
MPAHAAPCAEITAIIRAETLPRLDAHAAGRGWRVLAIGSSSTFGTGAKSPLHAYPARLEALLRAHAPHGDVTVVNAGVPGETADATLDRLAGLVAADRFDLVIWQVGTNDALRGVPEAELAGRLDRGVATARDAGVPLLVVDPQYFPGIPDRAAYERTVALVSDLAGARGVAVLRRYDVMRAWAERVDDRLAAMLAGDRFHMSDAGYACLAELIADALVADEAQRSPAPEVDRAAPTLDARAD